MRPLRAADKPWIFTGIRGKVLVCKHVPQKMGSVNSSQGQCLFSFMPENIILCCHFATLKCLSF